MPIIHLPLLSWDQLGHEKNNFRNKRKPCQKCLKNWIKDKHK